MTNLKAISNEPDLVGESPFWDAPSGQLFWVDIVGRKIKSRNLSSGQERHWATKDWPTAIALDADHDGQAVVSFGAGVAVFEFETGAVRFLARPETDPAMRLNEGKCDPQGRFWVASMENNLNPDNTAREMQNHCGRLFRVGPGDEPAIFSEAEFGIPNTMAWSPDRQSFYFADTLRNVIWVYDYDDAEGRVSNRRVLLEGGPGLPDGSGMDSEGCLWNARFGAGKVLRITPDGRIDREIAVPAQNPTACTFAGDDLKTLVVTSGRFGLDDAALAECPDAGRVFVMDAEVAGMPENYFRG
ncbi:SMP-30/gluconolactonase/LRE family protein [Cucumibacter marinus]|uniref:SMP-30/gluconolactonase/LRE family protein n=1 Tax=Cucumibacter marinus TaxID=1121252 RepID=UPI00040CF02B|nr:SMP-30/gluconolactonase/LRE family protein [Cucumibacter marinus]